MSLINKMLQDLDARGTPDGRGDAAGIRSVPERERGQGVSRALVFGGGHVGLETALLAERVDFKVVVLDDREEFVNPRRFPGMTPAQIRRYAERWQPWRSYALLHIWYSETWSPE